MTRHYTHLLLLLGLSWSIYGLCQQDYLLPAAAFVIITVGYLLRCQSKADRFAFMGRLPLAAVLVVAVIAGIIWRSVSPAPVAASALYIDIISVWQSVTVITAVLMWLKPYSLKNIYWLTALSWATVALSINVPFDEPTLLCFRLFCILSVINIFIHTLKKPADKARHVTHLKQLFIYGLSLMVIAGVLFRTIAYGLRVFDEMFMSFVGEYLIPRDYTHFLKISPFLTLTNPGASALDKRPVLEIESLGFRSIYLKTQVFDTYLDGVWKEPQDVPRAPLQQHASAATPKARMMMFVALQEIVPSPYVVAAAEGREALFQDANDIVYAEEARRTRVLDFYIGGPPPIELAADSADLKTLTALPPSLVGPLSEFAAGIVSPAMTDHEKAMVLQQFFRDKFKYTLNVDFRADEAGVMAMLHERRPAYCSYFATALVLLLRSQGIPARVAVGFSSSELTGPRNSRLLVRVKNAHAWSEALLPVEDPVTKETVLSWLPVDGTPSHSMIEVLNLSSSRLNILADKLWLFLLRSIAYVQNMDKDRAKRDALIVLTAILFLMNIKKIFRRLQQLRIVRRFKQTMTRHRQSSIESLYQRYEFYIERAFRETRTQTQTDEHLLKRLSARQDISEAKLERIHDFVDGYRAARFGGRDNSQLKDLLKLLEN